MELDLHEWCLVLDTRALVAVGTLECCGVMRPWRSFPRVFFFCSFFFPKLSWRTFAVADRCRHCARRQCPSGFWHRSVEVQPPSMGGPWLRLADESG